jgi:hypothetical protein
MQPKLKHNMHFSSIAVPTMTAIPPSPDLLVADLLASFDAL